MKAQTTILETCRQLETNGQRYLKRCYMGGEYVTERATEFWSKFDSDFCLAGERKTIGSDVVCHPMRYEKSALLVCLKEHGTGKFWYSWIHA